MTVRMLYQMFVRLNGWMVLLARSAASNHAELLDEYAAHYNRHRPH